RQGDRLASLAKETGDKAYGCDATVETAVGDLFAAVERDLGRPELVVFNAGGYVRKPIVELSVGDVENTWRSNCLGGFLVGRAAAQAMLPAGSGTIIFTGATAAMRGGANFAAFAMGKFGLRGLAQSMARELAPQGIHVAHFVIDGAIRNPGRTEPAGNPDSMLDPDSIAANYLHVLMQPRSAWTWEVELRPWVERF
ncbi:MAG: SDR family oxidoreductase, partial [Steroidobacterales bacterium]